VVSLALTAVFFDIQATVFGATTGRTVCIGAIITADPSLATNQTITINLITTGGGTGIQILVASVALL
jgi:hypothetical protein